MTPEKEVPEITQQKELTDEPSLLQSKPQRRSGVRWTTILLIAGCGVILIGGVALALQLLSRPQNAPASSTPGSANATQPASISKVGTPAANTCAPRLPWDMIKQDVANGLHLTVVQVTTQVHSGKNIQEVAAAQGFSPQQLHTLEINALRRGNAYWLRVGCIDQQGANDNEQRYTIETLQQLNDDFTTLFSH